MQADPNTAPLDEQGVDQVRELIQVNNQARGQGEQDSKVSDTSVPAVEGEKDGNYKLPIDPTLRKVQENVTGPIVGSDGFWAPCKLAHALRVPATKGKVVSFFDCFQTSEWEGLGQKDGFRVRIGQKLFADAGGLSSDQGKHIKVVAIYGGSTNLSSYHIIARKCPYDSNASDAFFHYTYETRQNFKWPLEHVQKIDDQVVIEEITTQEQQGAYNYFQGHLQSLGKNIATKPTTGKRSIQAPKVYTPDDIQSPKRRTLKSPRSQGLDLPMPQPQGLEVEKREEDLRKEKEHLRTMQAQVLQQSLKSLDEYRKREEHQRVTHALEIITRGRVDKEFTDKDIEILKLLKD